MDTYEAVATDSIKLKIRWEAIAQMNAEIANRKCWTITELGWLSWPEYLYHEEFCEFINTIATGILCQMLDDSDSKQVRFKNISIICRNLMP